MESRIEDGIVIATFPKSTLLTLEVAEQIVKNRLQLQNGKALPVVIHLNGLVSSSKAVRVFMANQGSEGISIGAFVVKKKYEEILINMFLTIDAPKVPTKIFSNEQDAIAWINTLR